MRRDFLKNLGIEDKEIIDKIIDENSADIGRAKGELETYKNKVTELEGQIGEKNEEITTLKTQVGDTNALNTKITELEGEKTNLTNQLNTKVSEIQKTHAIENSVRDAKAKNVKAVMALLDLDKITFNEGKLEGLDSQLEDLTKGDGTSFLFGETITPPSGTNLSNPNVNTSGNPSTSKTLAEAIAKTLSSNK